LFPNVAPVEYTTSSQKYGTAPGLGDPHGKIQKQFFFNTAVSRWPRINLSSEYLSALIHGAGSRIDPKVPMRKATVQIALI